MAQIYLFPEREADPHALPDAEVFYIESQNPEDAGWYWWACFPGCLPDGDPVGPFATESEAIINAQEDNQ